MSTIRPLPTSIPVNPDYLVGLIKGLPKAAVSVVDEIGAYAVNPAGTVKRDVQGLTNAWESFKQDPRKFVKATAINAGEQLANPETAAQAIVDAALLIGMQKLPRLRNTSVDDMVIAPTVAKRTGQRLFEEEKEEKGWFPRTTEALEKLPEDREEGERALAERAKTDPRVLEAQALAKNVEWLMRKVFKNLPEGPSTTAG